MTRTAKRTGQWKPWQLILRGVAVPLVLLLAVAALSGMIAIRQWVPQTGIRYLSYLTAAVFYLLAPLPMIKLIGKYPLPIACGYGILWTALFALFKTRSGRRRAAMRVLFSGLSSHVLFLSAVWWGRD